jgi:alpha-1,4-digalacturonate transport system substrate-binding protein
MSGLTLLQYWRYAVIRLLTLVLLNALMVLSPASADSKTADIETEISYFCYIKIECEKIRELLPAFNREYPGIQVKIELVPYSAIRETLPVQLAAGTGPDMASVTDFGGLNSFYLDLRPYVDAEYWERNFGPLLDWYRVGDDDHGIYALHTQLTLDGAYINKTLFEQAGIEIPGPRANWEEWVFATRKVATATHTQYPMAIDRSGHRISGPAISFGAKIFGDDGKPKVVDRAFAEFVGKFADWNNDGTFDKQVWAVGGASYRDARREFVNGDIVFYYSGSWQVKPFENAIGDAFDWAVVGSPCGPGGCSGMPGGTGLVGFRQTKHPEAVARFIDFFARKEVYKQLVSATLNIPAHKEIREAGLEFEGVSDTAAVAMSRWMEEYDRTSPVAIRFQGYPKNRAVLDVMVRRVTQVVVGEMTVEQAMERIERDLKKIERRTG